MHSTTLALHKRADEVTFDGIAGLIAGTTQPGESGQHPIVKRDDRRCEAAAYETGKQNRWVK